MSVLFVTDDPEQLKTVFFDAIEEGSIDTWSVDKDEDVTHRSTQWAKKAWFSVKATGEGLKFTFKRPKSGLEDGVKAAYHGLIVRVMLHHFSDKFTVFQGP